MICEIQSRRSIRRYRPEAVPREKIVEILQAGIAAPSAKNRQPWQFIVAEGSEKEALCKVMEQGIQRERIAPLLPESVWAIPDAENTLEIMRQAPVMILVINRLGAPLDRKLSPEERIYEICNVQSLGAAMENMTLEATAQGLGSLWICNTYFAYQELQQWIGVPGELMGALAVGWAAETPAARSRRGLQEQVIWRSE